MDIVLILEMMERLSVAATLAFVLSQTTVFRQLIFRQLTLKDKILLSVVFGLIGILGTYAGIPVFDALANSRVVGVMAAGLIGGPAIGLTAGLIAGGHRFFLGGFTAGACAISNICEGLLGGLIYRWYPIRPMPLWVTLLSGIVGESMQMGIILLLAKPFDKALSLVNEIAIPMIVVNSIGISIFMLIIKTSASAQVKVGSEQSQKALEIATKTLAYLRRGLARESAEATAQIILAAGGYDAVAVTDHEKVLAFVGEETEHHPAGTIGLTQATQKVLVSGEIHIAQHPDEIGCACNSCRLRSAVIVPLKRFGIVIGALKLYSTRLSAMGQADVVFAMGLAHLFSTQLELTEIDRQAKLASRAELKALHAQINPHFLFNTLNTITSLVRTKPELARELLIKLAAIFRHTLHKTGRDITIAEELAHVRAYLTIEKARYGRAFLPLLGP